VLLSSCFFANDPQAEAVGKAILELPENVRPHVKFFCGDQVYLDIPELAFLPLTGEALARKFFGEYIDNWSE
jgi:hypothetical protein